MIRRIAEAVRIAFGPHDRCAVGGDAVGDRLVGPVGHEDLEGLVDCSSYDRGGEGGVAAAGDGEPFGLRFRQREAEGDTEEVASLWEPLTLPVSSFTHSSALSSPIASASADWGPNGVEVKPAVDRRHCGVESLDRVEHR